MAASAPRPVYIEPEPQKPGTTIVTQFPCAGQSFSQGFPYQEVEIGGSHADKVNSAFRIISENEGYCEKVAAAEAWAQGCLPGADGLNVRLSIAGVLGPGGIALGARCSGDHVSCGARRGEA